MRYWWAICFKNTNCNVPNHSRWKGLSISESCHELYFCNIVFTSWLLYVADSGRSSSGSVSAGSGHLQRGPHVCIRRGGHTTQDGKTLIGGTLYCELSVLLKIKLLALNGYTCTEGKNVGQILDREWRACSFKMGKSQLELSVAWQWRIGFTKGKMSETFWIGWYGHWVIFFKLP